MNIYRIFVEWRADILSLSCSWAAPTATRTIKCMQAKEKENETTFSYTIYICTERFSESIEFMRELQSCVIRITTSLAHYTLHALRVFVFTFHSIGNDQFIIFMFCLILLSPVALWVCAYASWLTSVWNHRHRRVYHTQTLSGKKNQDRTNLYAVRHAGAFVVESPYWRDKIEKMHSNKKNI